jgi:putative Mg2+ transporter-C (MgtC) family protein
VPLPAAGTGLARQMWTMEAFHPHLFGLVELVGAFLLALPIGWDREQHDRSMGLRTFPLISVASCAFLVIAQRAMPEHPGEWNKTLEGVATGVGFLGAGAIVKHGITVLGTATAAGVWMTAAMGAAAAFGEWPIAIALSAIGFGTLRLVRRATPKGKSTDRGDLLQGKAAPAGSETRAAQSDD